MIDKKAGKMLCLIVFFVGFLIINSACSLKKEQQIIGTDDWENEVLLAKDCGMDGLRCCADKDQPCQFGQSCCISPLDSDRNQCLDDCTCGIEKGFCCAGDNPCGDGLACSAGICLPCGDANEPCCTGEASCNGGLVCHNSICVECGMPGNPCCAGENACRGQGKTDSTRAECLNDICIYCGSDGKVACPADPICLPYNLLNNGFCYKCGGLNLPCCSLDSGAAYDCDGKAGLTCQLGFCTEAGAKIIQ